MKVVTQKYQSEDAKYYCDKHKDRECNSELVLSSWYGSSFDMNVVKVHLCDECILKMYAYLKQEFNVEPEPMYDY